MLKSGPAKKNWFLIIAFFNGQNKWFINLFCFASDEEKNSNVIPRLVWQTRCDGPKMDRRLLLQKTNDVSKK